MMWLIVYALAGMTVTLYFMKTEKPDGYSDREDFWLSILMGTIWPVTILLSILIILGVIGDGD